MENVNLVREKTFDNFITEKTDIIQHSLMGIYNNKDEYIISDKIKSELLQMEKIKKQNFNNSIFCVANKLGVGEIVFEIVYGNKTSNNMVEANLFVLESVQKVNGYIINTIKTHIAKFVSDYNNFIEKTYDYFNIIVAFDDDGRDKLIDDEFLNSYIIAKKQFSLAMVGLTTPKLNKLYEKYFYKRVELLRDNKSDYSNAILDDYQTQYNKIKNVFLDDAEYKVFNELLDACFENHSGITKYMKDEISIKKLITPVLTTFSKNVDEIVDSAESKAVTMLHKSDRVKVEEILSEKVDEKTAAIEAEQRKKKFNKELDYYKDKSHDTDVKTQTNKTLEDDYDFDNVVYKTNAKHNNKESNVFENNNKTAVNNLSEKSNTNISNSEIEKKDNLKNQNSKADNSKTMVDNERSL